MENFFIKKKIYYHDTDCGGVVYYANYLKFMEEARTEFLLAKDISLKDYQKKGIWFVVKKVEIEYIYSAKYMDEICISCWLEKLKNFSFVFLQEVFFKDKKFASSKIKIVCVDNNFRLLKIPDIIADKINS